MTKILLVEDDKSLREIYGVRLLAEGYDIISAGDGEEALAMAIKEKPALIVSDVMMPKISGYDMLDILRSTTETRNTKVIMMTALSSDDQRQRAEELGADKYLVKSQVGIEDVVRAVHEVLEDSPSGVSQPQIVTAPAPAPAPAPAAPTTSQSPVIAQTPTPIADQTIPSVAAVPTQVTPPPAVPPVPQAPVINPDPAPQPTVPVSVAPEPQQPATNPATQNPAQTPATVASPPESTLPQPTAPFSTSRPDRGNNRVIEPLQRPEENQAETLKAQIDRELEGNVNGPTANLANPTVPVQTPMPAQSVSDNPTPDPLTPPPQMQ
ncbi:response regulator [Candidatus Saccharibacteria bacterium]|jgi:CheY-like chemotaxis protein|nr:response regulator [Candidatus Saccharibacteria bacterium]